MKKLDRQGRKSYAMRRMVAAIERAIERPARTDKERAARWAAAWGLLCGIRTDSVRLKTCDVQSPEIHSGERSDASASMERLSLPQPGSTQEPQFQSPPPAAVQPASHSAAGA